MYAQIKVIKQGPENLYSFPMYVLQYKKFWTSLNMLCMVFGNFQILNSIYKHLLTNNLFSVSTSSSLSTPIMISETVLASIANATAFAKTFVYDQQSITCTLLIKVVINKL